MTIKLTDEQISAIALDYSLPGSTQSFARAVIAADRAQRQAGQEAAFYANDDLARDFATGGQGGMWVRTAKGGDHNTPLFTAPPAAPAEVTKDLALLVWRLASSLRRAKPDSTLAQDAIAYVNRVGLTPSPLR